MFFYVVVMTVFILVFFGRVAWDLALAMSLFTGLMIMLIPSVGFLIGDVIICFIVACVCVYITRKIEKALDEWVKNQEEND